MERRLSAILAADVVGYSRLMGEDEVGTHAAVKAHRTEVMDPKAAQYGSRTTRPTKPITPVRATEAPAA